MNGSLGTLRLYVFLNNVYGLFRSIVVKDEQFFFQEYLFCPVKEF